MDTTFMNSENIKTSDPHKLLLNQKMNLKWNDNYVALSNLSGYYTWKNIKNSYKNNEFRIPTPTQNEEFELFDGSCFVSDIPDLSEYIIYNIKKD